MKTRRDFLAVCLTGCLAVWSSNCRAADGLVVYSTKFDGRESLASGVKRQWTGHIDLQPSSDFGYQGLGLDGNLVGGRILYNDTGDGYTGQPSIKSTLTLNGLPQHQTVDLNFLLLVIDTWDGNRFRLPGDTFFVEVDGSIIFQEAFTNTHEPFPPPGQTYMNPAMLVHYGNYQQLFDMSLDESRFLLPHTADSLTVSFWAGGADWNRPANEAWGIDNLSVVLPGVVVVPEPASASLFALGAVAMSAIATI